MRSSSPLSRSQRSLFSWSPLRRIQVPFVDDLPADVPSARRKPPPAKTTRACSAETELSTPTASPSTTWEKATALVVRRPSVAPLSVILKILPWSGLPSGAKHSRPSAASPAPAAPAESETTQSWCLPIMAMAPSVRGASAPLRSRRNVPDADPRSRTAKRPPSWQISKWRRDTVESANGMKSRSPMPPPSSGAPPLADGRRRPPTTPFFDTSKDRPFHSDSGGPRHWSSNTGSDASSARRPPGRPELDGGLGMPSSAVSKVLRSSRASHKGVAAPSAELYKPAPPSSTRSSTSLFRLWFGTSMRCSRRSPVLGELSWWSSQRSMADRS
mmetsp:Transcript_18635/g.60643  ORF Transcript_18635/g.60643 Transcript_18635/m.60643 type:complete len:329 (-) Transcript_18635:208-1194(-)